MPLPLESDELPSHYYESPYQHLPRCNCETTTYAYRNSEEGVQIYRNYQGDWATLDHRYDQILMGRNRHKQMIHLADGYCDVWPLDAEEEAELITQWLLRLNEMMIIGRLRELDSESSVTDIAPTVMFWTTSSIDVDREVIDDCVLRYQRKSIDNEIAATERQIRLAKLATK